MKNVEDAFPLSPMQQGLLFHTVFAQTPGMYLEQVRATLEGDLDLTRLREAWQRVVDRHSVLRTAMVWEGLDDPLQIVRRQVSLPWSEHDLRSLDHETQQARLGQILKADRDRGFELARAPLMRCTVVRRTDRECELIWTYHHMILDGWCSSIIVHEVFTIYQALGDATEPVLEEPRPYREYISWLSKQDRGGAEHFWREVMQGVACPTELRLEQGRRNALADYESPGEYAEHVLTLAPDLVEAVRALARSHRLTVNTILQGAWAVLLSRYSGEDDVVFGATVSGRPPHLQGVESMLGLFVNTLPVRVRVGPEEGLVPWLEHLQARHVDREEYAFTSLVDIQSWVGLPPGTRLFETVVAFENYPIDDDARAPAPGLRITDSRVSMEETNYPLVLQVVPEPELTLRVLFDAVRYPQGAIARLCRHLATILEAFTSSPQQKLGQLSLLSEVELRHLQMDWAAASEAPVSHRCLHEQFEVVAARTPEAVAVTADGKGVTYRELNSRANRLARYLVNLGVGPEVLVGLCLDRSAELIVALLAILKAGGAYLPLDPRHPRRRVAFVLEDARAPVVVTTSELARELPTQGATVVALDVVGDALADLPDDDLSVEVGAENLAYVIYTSGSTGRPKGSLITHRNVSRLLSSTQPRFQFGATDVWTLFHTIAFDFSVWEIWGALLYGGRMVVVPHWVCRTPDEFLDLLVMEGVTVLNQTPSAFRQLMLAEEELPTTPSLALRLVIFGGERLDLASLRPWFDRHGEDCPRLVNMYGITETTVHVTWRFLGRSDLEASGSLIGEPIPDLRVAILDSRRIPLPIGVAGELCVAGPGLSRGYLNREELTRQRFIDSPFPVPAGERLYCSGDLVRRLSGGDLEYLGRIDQQVKVRGFRIELGEIEGVLIEHPGVREGVVVARGEAAREGGEPTLVAYAVPSDGSGEGVDGSGDGDGLKGEVVRQWERVFEDSYHGGPTDRDVTFDITGWNSSYTGGPIAGEEMREWVEGTVERIRALAPHRVLEIGCGTGLLAGRIAPHSDSYVATDFSQEALAVVERLIANSPQLAHVRLLCRAADEFNGLDREGFDTVVLNSVVQYFPSVDYLVDVVQGAFDCLGPGGALFIGDVRSRSLLSAFHASVELHRAPAATTLNQLKQRVLQRTAQEEELVLDPEFFAALGSRLDGVAEVAAQLRRGRFQNEMTRFRYDVVIRKEGAAAVVDEFQVDWRSWHEGSSTLLGLRVDLEAERPTCIGLRGVPNARLSAEVELLRRLEETGTSGSVAALRSSLADGGRGAMDPEDLWELGDELSYRVEIAFSAGEVGCFDAILSRGSHDDRRARLLVLPPTERSPGARPWRRWANDPTGRLRSRQLAEELHLHLKECLPDYMVPAHVVVLEALPLTANGKVDRKALPEPEVSSRSGDADDRPRDACEEILVGIWADVLGVTTIGRNDDFFDMGGHSLMATQVISRVRSAFAVDVPMRQLFATPTVAGFAAAVEARRKAGHDLEEPALVSGQAGEYPSLSFSQQRMWFLDQLEGGETATYNVPLAVELRGPLDLDALARSLERVVARHDSLRTVFLVRNGAPYQRVHPPEPVTVEVVDLADTESASRADEGLRRIRADAMRPFDLSSDPMLRANVYRMGEGEHLLLLCMHHICADGWSTGVLFRELAHLYGAFARGQEPEPLLELPVQYADYAVWQRRWLTGETLEGQLAYWRTRLSGSQELLNLPTDRPRPSVLRFRGRSVSFFLDEELTRRLRLLGHRCGATLYMTLLAGFGALLHRYSGVDRLVIGTPVANRRRSEVEPLIGFFANTLALDVDCSGDPSFRGLLERVRGAALGAYDHQDLPFEALVEALQPHRDLGHTPLFQTMFVLQNTTVDAPRLPGLSARTVDLDLGVSKFDLTLGLEEERDGLAGELQYSTDLFDPSTANRIITHYRNLLAAAVERPGSRLWQLPLLDEGERTQLTVASNERGGAAAEADPLPFHLEFARRVEEDPDRPAVVARDGTVTYGELDARAESLAKVLRQAGVGPETLVPVCVERGPSWVVAVLAVARAGGAFVVMDPAYPQERLAYTVADTGASIVVTEEGQRHRFADLAVKVVMVEPQVATALPDGPGTAEDGSPQHAAYAVFTSGSTGRPKAVVVTHGSLSNLLRAQVERFDIGPGDRILQFVAPTFDVAVADVGMALSTGAALCVAPTEDLLPGRGLIELMRDLGVTHIAAPPSALAAGPTGDLPALRVVITGGETCPHEVVERWAPNRRFFNCYGPTEATICATLAEYKHDGCPLTIGRPLDNVTAYILDGHRQMAPIGVAGELHIGGRGVARGYLGLPELSADRFVPNPFDVSGGARLYRTGDLARFLGDGSIEFLGRMDRQLKIRGYRVEPEEIEAVLCEHPAVSQAAVVTMDSAAGDTQLAACVTVRDGSELAMDDLRDHLRRRLPHFMLPSRLLSVASLPLAGTGKIDYRALRQELATAEETPPAPSREMTDDEVRMARIWREVLGRSHVGVDESFFECGGHSLAAMRVIARVHEELGIEVPVRVLFEAPTLAAFSRAVVDGGRDIGDAPPLRRMERKATNRTPGGRRDPQ